MSNRSEMRHARHMEGFEKECALNRMHGHPHVRSRLYMWNDFMAVARVINPALCDHAFERRPCERTLRYIGHEDFEEPVRSEQPDLEGFVHGHIYHSIDFNGATYTLRGKAGESLIGCAYFEVVEDEETERK